MALRVLLADESSTIKKVIQLALQDFAVEVKAVHSGVDVLEVARAFNPDIIFADILLPKRNGYDVTGELKRDMQLGSVPVILMWSAFMDLDEDAFEESLADGRLEKPFDVEGLRSLVTDLVPKTASQRLASFLKFPDSFTAPLRAEEKQRSLNPPTPVQRAPVTSKEPAATKRPGSKWNMDSFEEPDLPDLGGGTDEDADNFAPMRLKTQKNQTSPESPREDTFTDSPLFHSRDSDPLIVQPDGSAEEDEGIGPRTDDPDPWAHQDLSRFKVELPPVEVESEDISVVFDVNEGEIQGTDFLYKGDRKSPTVAQPASPLATAAKPAAAKPAAQHAAEPAAAATRAPAPNTTRAVPKTSSKSVVSEPPPAPVEDGVFELSPSEESEVIELTNFGDDELDGQVEPLEPLSLEPSGQILESGEVPNLSADRLEEIIRAQSKEIIESVVRKLVPDIASDMIRRELDRLLKESQNG